jgi:peptide/nickel transport system ATP-binding protein
VSPATSSPLDPPPPPPRVRVEGLRKAFGNGRGRGGGTVAVDGVSFSILAGEIYGLVGGSGAGKSTLARLVLRLLPADAGRVWVDGQDLFGLRRRELRRMRRRIQMVGQDPFQALHPGMAVHELVGEPLAVHRVGNREDRTEMVRRALDEVALSPAGGLLDRYPNDLSGGQRQRVAIARAIVLEPTLLVADEPTSMLDASVQLGILNVLRSLQANRGLSALVITHDLAVARYVCDRIGVMHAGRIVEEGPVDQVIAAPLHDYTRALLAASED